MRVLMTADAVGGVWTYALELSSALRMRDIDVTLATMGPRPSREQLADAARRSVDVRVSRFALEWEQEPWRDVDRAGDWLLELGDELKPDLVHLNGYVHAALPWTVPTVVVAHSDVLSWWQAVHGTTPPNADRYRLAVEAGLRAADAVIAPTRAVVRDLSRHYRLRTAPVVVPNGRATIPRIAPKDSLILAVGRFWDRAKNLEALERVAPRLSWPVLAVGPGSPLGPRTPDELDELRGRAAVFCSPARYEPFGLAALEAAAAGCALVLGDVASLREVWHDAALFAPPEDDDALRAALQLAIDNAKLRRDLAARARRRAVWYSAERMAEGTDSVYRTVLAKGAAA